MLARSIAKCFFLDHAVAYLLISLEIHDVRKGCIREKIKLVLSLAVK